MNSNSIDANSFISELLNLENDIDDVSMSMKSALVDIHSICSIIDFFNDNNKLSWRTHLFFVRYISVVMYELGVLTEIDVCNEYDLHDVKLLRKKLHQFRFREFNKYIESIELEMGRSRDELAPNLDLTLEYKIFKNKKLDLIGTNIWQFYLLAENSQEEVKIMQRFYRVIQKEYPLSHKNCKLESQKEQIEIKAFPYCYTDIMKNSLIKNDKLRDRVLLSFDELSSATYFFCECLDINSKLKEHPYILWFLSKVISTVLDETIDNLENFTKNNVNDCNNSDVNYIEDIITSTDNEIKSDARSLRNSIHYKRIEPVRFDDVNDIYNYLLDALEECKMIRSKLLKLLNIKPQIRKLKWYNFLRWVQSAY